MVQEVLRRQLRRPGVRRAGDQGRGGGRILQQTWQGKFVLFINVCTLQGAPQVAIYCAVIFLVEQI